MKHKARNSLVRKTNNRITTITSLKSSMLMSDFDLLTRYMRVSEEEAQRIISRNKIQKLEDLKIQIIGQNPQLLGVGVPGADAGGQEMGAEMGGPTPDIGGEQPPDAGGPPDEGAPPEGEPPQGDSEGSDSRSAPPELPEPTDEELKKYDLGMEDYSRVVDGEDIDWSEEE